MPKMRLLKLIGVFLIILINTSCKKTIEPQPDDETPFPECPSLVSPSQIESLVGYYFGSYTFSINNINNDPKCPAKYVSKVHSEYQNNLQKFSVEIDSYGRVTLFRENKIFNRSFTIYDYNPIKKELMVCDKGEKFKWFAHAGLLRINNFPDPNRNTVFTKKTCSEIDTLSGLYKGTIRIYSYAFTELYTYTDTILPIINISDQYVCKLLNVNRNDTIFIVPGGVISSKAWNVQRFWGQNFKIGNYLCNPYGNALPFFEFVGEKL